MDLFLKTLLFLVLPIIIFSCNHTKKINEHIKNESCKENNKHSIIVNKGHFNIDDLKIRSLPSNNLVFNSKQQTNKIETKYGAIGLHVFHKNKLIGHVSVYDKNWCRIHKLLFDFTSTDSLSKFDFSIDNSDKELEVIQSFFEFDSINLIQTRTFYDKNGLTGQIGKKYYTASNEILVGEFWNRGVLINLNLYNKGKYDIRYTSARCNDRVSYSIKKIDSLGFLVYDLEELKTNPKSKRIVIRKHGKFKKEKI
jgi:hypothetical protein